MRQSIAIDMDEVLADTLKKVMFKVNEATGENITFDDIRGIKFNQKYPQYTEVLREILLDRSFFRDLEVLPEAVRVVEELTKHYDVFIATAAMDVPTSFDAKYEWLQEHFPFLNSQNIVFCGDKGVIRTDYLIDDNPRQLKAFKGKSILFDATHNIHETEFTRVKNWNEVEDYFLKDK